MDNLRLILVDPKPALCTAFREHFNGLPNVEVVNGYFEQLPEFDCMVSAANSFGLMDGGIDLAIIRFFGHSLQEKVQKHILKEYMGEQPVGTSFIVEGYDPRFSNHLEGLFPLASQPGILPFSLRYRIGDWFSSAECRRT